MQITCMMAMVQQWWCRKPWSSSWARQVSHMVGTTVLDIEACRILFYYLCQVWPFWGLSIIWAKVIFSLLYSGFKRCFAHSVIVLCSFAQLPGDFVKIAFFKKLVPIFFSNFPVWRLIWKKLFLLCQNTMKMRFHGILCFFKEKTPNDIWNFVFCPKMAVL